MSCVFLCLYNVLYMCSSKLLGPQKSATLGACLSIGVRGNRGAMCRERSRKLRILVDDSSFDRVGTRLFFPQLPIPLQHSHLPTDPRGKLQTVYLWVVFPASLLLDF